MTRPTDFDQLLDLLRGGPVPPDELARLARAWDPRRDPPFLDYVAGPVTASVGAAFVPAAPADATASFGTPDPAAEVTPPATPGPEPSTPGGTTADFHPDPNALPLPAAPPGGRYVPLRHHRSGGLGAVWVARDTAVGRDVALKTIRPDHRHGPAEADGFVREAQVTGRLEHPCVVPVYDLPAARAGDGPCYVMRLVAGRTLAEATADYHKARAAGTADPLALAGLLDAVVAVARAVGFAHGKGVLHRDLKGQNVILGDHGEVFLLDWGLALDEADAGPGGDVESGLSSGWAALPAFARITPPRSAAGTPGFMAPEVAERGESSRAADVYGLGGVLYQVLAGRPPYTGPNHADILRQLKDTEPPPVRSLNPTVPPALAAICHQALTRDPAGRYSSAEAFATDLRRFLADEPVEAYREPWAARAARWARRHRTGVAAAAAALVVAAVGSSATAALVWREKENTAAEFVRAEGEWKRAEGEKVRAEGEWKRAEENFAAAGGLASEFVRQAAAVEAGGVPRQSDVARKATMDRVRTAFDRLAAERPADPALRRQAATLHRYAANLGRFLGDFDGAGAAYASSLRLWRGLADDPAGPASDLDSLVLTLRDHAAYHMRAGRLGEAGKQLTEADQLAAKLAGRVPASALHRTTGVVELDRAAVAFRLGRFAEAEAAAGRAADTLDRLAGLPPLESGPADVVMRTAARHAHAGALRELKRFPEGWREHDAAVRLADAELAGNPGRDARQYANKTRVGRAATALADPSGRVAARRELDEVIPSAGRLAAAFPTAVAYKELLAEAHVVRAELAAAAGDAAAAAADFERAKTLTRELLDTFGNLPDHVVLRGRVFLGLGRLAATPAAAEPLLAGAGTLFAHAAKADPENALVRRWQAEVARARQDRAAPR